MEIPGDVKPPSSLSRGSYSRIWVCVCVLGLAIVYIFQRVDCSGAALSLLGMGDLASPNVTFAINKALRLIVNDLICLGLIAALFGDRKYVRVAMVIFCFEFFFMLPLYLTLKLSLEGTSEISSPLLSQIHRLIVNPLLMLLLIVGFYYQRFTDSAIS
jgi:exosortase F-associated protein